MEAGLSSLFADQLLQRLRGFGFDEGCHLPQQQGHVGRLLVPALAVISLEHPLREGGAGEGEGLVLHLLAQALVWHVLALHAALGPAREYVPCDVHHDLHGISVSMQEAQDVMGQGYRGDIVAYERVAEGVAREDRRERGALLGYEDGVHVLEERLHAVPSAERPHVAEAGVGFWDAALDLLLQPVGEGAQVLHVLVRFPLKGWRQLFTDGGDVAVEADEHVRYGQQLFVACTVVGVPAAQEVRSFVSQEADRAACGEHEVLPVVFVNEELHLHAVVADGACFFHTAQLAVPQGGCEPEERKIFALYQRAAVLVLEVGVHP